MLNLLRFHILVRLLVGVFCLINTYSVLPAQIFLPPPPAAIADSLTKIWQEEVNDFGATGGIIAIHIPGQWYWSMAEGNALISPMVQADTSFSFRAGSLSKSMVSAGLLKLQEQAILDLDDTIDVWLDPAVAATIPNSGAISIRQLLLHQSGVGNYTSNPVFATTLLTSGVGHVFTPQDLINLGVAGGALFPPGAGWEYSNTNYVIAALILEKAANMDYETYINNTFFVPLGMNSSYFPTTDTLPGSFMGSYANLDNMGAKENLSYVDPSGTFGSGALVSKLPDFVKWLIALKDNQVLSGQSRFELLSFFPTTDPQTRYGLGIAEYDNGIYQSFGHTGAVFNSSNMQYIDTLDAYIVYNLTDPDFNHVAFVDRIYNFLAPAVFSCAGFQGGTITGPANPGIYPGQEEVDLMGPTIPGGSYQWLKDGQVIPGANGTTFQAGEVGTYSLQMSNAAGCVVYSNEITLTDCTPYNVGIAGVAESATYCLGAVVQLNAGGTQDTVDWFDQGNALLQNNANTLTFTAQQNGFVYSVSTNSAGCVSRDTLEVIVAATPIANLGPDQQLCPNSELDLEAGSPGDSVTWYDISGTVLLANSTTFSVPIEQDTSIIVEVNNGCGSARDTLSIAANQSAAVNLGPDQEVCAGTVVSLQAGVQGDVVKWLDLAGNLILDNSNTLLTAAVRDSAIIVDVTNSCGNAKDTVLLSVTEFPTANLGPDQVVCVNTPFGLEAGSLGDTVSWYDISGNLLLANSENITISVVQDTSIVVEVSNTCGTARDTLDITFDVNAGVNLGPDQNVCAGAVVNLQAGNQGDAIKWLDTAGTVLLENVNSFSTTALSDRIIIVELDNSCGLARDTINIDVFDTPVANLGPDKSICPNSQLDLEAGSAGDEVSWFDLSGGLLLANSNNLSIAVVGDTSIVVQVSNACGVSRDTLNVLSDGAAGVDLGPDREVCAGTLVSLQAGAIGDVVAWYNLAGDLLGDANTLLTAAVRDSIIIVDLTNSCGNSRDSILVTVTEFPTIDLGPDREVCIGASLTLQAGSGDDLVNWYDLNQTLLLGGAQTYSPTIDRDTSILVDVRNSCGTSQDTVRFTAVTTPSVDLGDDFSSCIGSTLSFSAGVTGDRVSWFNGNGGLLLSNNLEYSFVLTEDFQLVVEKLTDCGSVRDTVNITANNVDPVNLGPDIRLCKGESRALLAENNTEPLNWYIQDGNILVSNIVSYQFTADMSQFVVAERTGSCASARDTINIVVIDQPVVDLGPDTTITSGDRITLMAGEAGDLVNWYNTDGILILGNNPVYFFNPTGPTTVIAEVTNADNCTGRDTINIDVTTSVVRPEEIGLQVFPNPVKDKIRIAWEQPVWDTWSWELRNLQGQAIRSDDSNLMLLEVPVGNLPEGVYFLRVRKGTDYAYVSIKVSR